MYAAYSSDKDSNIKVEEDFKNEARLSMFDKGQSKRIWGELFKVCLVTPHRKQRYRKSNNAIVCDFLMLQSGDRLIGCDRRGAGCP